MKNLLLMYILIFFLSVIIFIRQANASNVTAANGSAVAIQAAVDQVSADGGGNVFIPAGVWNFTPVGVWTTVTVPAGVNIYGAPNQRYDNGSNVEWNTVLRMSWDVPSGVESGQPPGKGWFRLIGIVGSNKTCRFSDIKMLGNAEVNASTVYATSPITIANMQDFRVDHCYFRNLRSAVNVGSDYYQTKNAPVNGVIDHNLFINTGGDPGRGYGRSKTHTVDYGIMPYGTSSNDVSIWDPNIYNVVGHYTNFTVFIEDNYFSYWRHAVSANNGMHYVFRHNVVEGSCGIGDVDAHQAYTFISTRAMEIYDNQFLDPATNATTGALLWDDQPNPVNLRGGALVMFNNQIRDYMYAVGVVGADGNTVFPRGTPTTAECPAYAWNNTNLHGGAHWDQYRNGQFWLGANPVQMTPMPNYIPYPYPHPLTLGQTPQPPMSEIRGTLMDRNGQAISSTITVYQGTNVVNSTTALGGYSLSVTSGIYDVQFNFSGVSLKFSSVNAVSGVTNLINYVNKSDERLSFTLDVSKEQLIQIDGPAPTSVYLNQTRISDDASLGENTYHYDGAVHLHVMPYIKSDCPFDCCDEPIYYNKVCPSGQFCSNHACLPSFAGLVSYWSFDSVNASGVFDSAGSSFASFVGGLSQSNLTTGRIGNGLRFDGVNDALNAGNSASLNPSLITLEAWIYPTSTPSVYERIIGKETTTTANPYSMQFIPGNALGCYIGDGSSSTGAISAGNTITLNAWQLVDCTYNGTHISAYVNGNLVATQSYSGGIPSRTTSVTIGNNPTNSRQFAGIMDEVKIWNRTLTESEIVAHANV